MTVGLTDTKEDLKDAEGMSTEGMRAEPGDEYQERLAALRRLQSEFGRVWQGLRKRATRPCAVCGTVMEGVVGNRKYCSGACQAKAWRQRHPDYTIRRRLRRRAGTNTNTQST